MAFAPTWPTILSLSDCRRATLPMGEISWRNYPTSRQWDRRSWTPDGIPKRGALHPFTTGEKTRRQEYRAEHQMENVVACMQVHGAEIPCSVHRCISKRQA